MQKVGNPDWHVIFHVIWFFNTNGDVAKNFDCESLENFPEKIMEFVLIKLQVCVV